MQQHTFTLQDISWNTTADFKKKNAAINQVNIFYSPKTLTGNAILGRI